jgi:predicted secreted protein
MNLLVALIIFILFWWALLATIFSFQLHKQNEDYARRLGERIATNREVESFRKNQIRDSILLPIHVKASISNHVRLNLIKIWRLIPIKITSNKITTSA